jgi:hypothetical protein
MAGTLESISNALRDISLRLTRLESRGVDNGHPSDPVRNDRGPSDFHFQPSYPSNPVPNDRELSNPQGRPLLPDPELRDMTGQNSNPMARASYANRAPRPYVRPTWNRQPPPRWES